MRRETPTPLVLAALFVIAAAIMAGLAARDSLSSDPSADPAAERGAERRARPAPVRRKPLPRERVSRASVARAKRVGRAFLGDYLPFSYGRGPGRFAGATAALQRELAASPPRVPPTVRQRQARITAMQGELTEEGNFELLAFVADGERTYTLTLGMEPAGESWQVSSLAG
ncbi:MAG: hypothetical protein M3433_01735 [Actinomycetota bacterium]|nr:hypothetical protein [Actinomycetota bacterium]